MSDFISIVTPLGHKELRRKNTIRKIRNERGDEYSDIYFEGGNVMVVKDSFNDLMRKLQEE